MGSSVIISPRRSWRIAWGVSIALHIAFLVVVILAIANSHAPSLPATRGFVIDGQWNNDPSAMATVDSPSQIPRPQPIEPVDTGELNPRWSEVMAVAGEDAKPLENSPSDLASFVSNQIQQSVKQGKQRSSEDNLERLSHLSRRLNHASSQHGVDEMANFLGGLVGARANEPIPEQEGKTFDVQTAQIDRVRKETDPFGKTHYIATMIDSQGVTTEIELDRESGAQLYKVMKLIESNPLLERVYRKIVMGFLDQALREYPSAPQNANSGSSSPEQPMQSETR